MPKVKPLVYSPDAEIEQVIINIEYLLRVRGLMGTKRIEWLSQKAGVTPATVYNYFKKKETMPLGVLCRIANALGVPVGALWRKAEFREEAI